MYLSDTLKEVYDTLHHNLTRISIPVDNDSTTEITTPTGDAVKQTKTLLKSMFNHDDITVKESLVQWCNIILDCANRTVTIHIGQTLHTDENGYHRVLQCDKEVVRVSNGDDTIHYYIFPVEGVYRLKDIYIGLLEGAYHDIPKCTKHPKEHYVEYCVHLVEILNAFFINNPLCPTMLHGRRRVEC